MNQEEISNRVAKKLAPDKFPAFQPGWWVRQKYSTTLLSLYTERSRTRNNGIILEYCGYYLPGEFVKTNYPRADRHNISGHIYHVERHMQNCIDEFRDYYISEEYIECDI